MSDLHPIQHHILKELLFRPTVRFSALNTTHLPTDQFTFHLNRLVELGLILKTPTGYTLSTPGKEYANRIFGFYRQREIIPYSI